MDILAATSMALVAGVAEGTSVLKHYCKTNDSEDESIVIPSLVYGTISLPLTVIGASPSAPLVARMSGLHIQEKVLLQEEEEELNSTDHHKSNHQNGTSSSINMRRTMKLGLPGNGDIKAANEDVVLTNPAGGLNVNQLREDNRRALAAMNEKRLHQDRLRKEDSANIRTQSPSAAVMQKDKFEQGRIQGRPSSNSTTSTSLLGTRLPTQFAENMRRARILLLGYGIVSATIVYQAHKKNEQNSSKSDEPEREISERDCAAVRKYMECDHCELGVAMRMMNDRIGMDEIIREMGKKSRMALFQGGMSAPCSLPIICSQETGVAPQQFSQSDLETGNKPPYWALGQNRQEWDEIPLSERMYFGGIDGSGRRYVLLESIISTSIKDGASLQRLRHLQLSDKCSSTQHAEINSLKIQHALKKKCKEEDIGVAHIMIGTTIDDTGRTGTIDILPSQRVIINSMDAMAFGIVKSINQILNKADEIKREESKATDDESTTDDMPNSLPETEKEAEAASTTRFLKAVDYVGRQIRNGGELVVSTFFNTIDTVGRKIRQGGTMIVRTTGALRKSFRRSPKPRVIINIYSDDLNIVAWLKGVLGPCDFQIVWHDVRRDDFIGKFPKASSTSTDLFLVLCSNDDDTIHATMTLMSNFPPDEQDKIISVVESYSARDTLEAFLDIDDEARTTMEPICAASIHEELIAYAKSLLIGKNMSPSEVQKNISSTLAVEKGGGQS